MSRDRIDRLHEQASELYLNGDYAGALEAWRDVLGLDPDNEEAQGGVRMASQFIAPDSQPAADAAAPAAGASAAGEVEQELELGLKVLDGFDVEPMLDPDRVDGATDRAPSPPDIEEPAAEETLDGWDTSPPEAGDEESVGLEPMQQSSTMPMPLISAASSELQRRVNDLLAQAKTKAEAGERDEALSVLARLAILDEDNTEAAELRAKIESAGASDLDRVELAIIEGVDALGADRLDDAERYFNEALAIVPGHREAKHYLEKLAERRASGEEDLLGSAIGEAPPAEGAVAAAVPAEAHPQKPQQGPHGSGGAVRPPREPLDPPAVASSRRLSLPPPKVLLMGGTGLLVVVLAMIAIPKMFGGRPNPAPPPAPPAVHRPKPPVKTGTGGGAAATSDPGAQAGVASAADGIRKGREALAAGDFGGAVIAFNQALAIDPANTEAKAGFDQARDRYKVDKEERDAKNSIKLAFRDGEFTSALRLAYRLPPTIAKSYIDGVKVAGWYNLAVVALRAGDCKGALTQIDEALDVAPLDADAKALKSLRRAMSTPSRTGPSSTGSKRSRSGRCRRPRRRRFPVSAGSGAGRRGPSRARARRRPPRPRRRGSSRRAARRR